MRAPTFESEAAMCAQFCDWLKLKGWTPYAETAGWDVLAVAPDGFQIGVQAKMSLNPAVVCQALEDDHWLGASNIGPDCRAVLAPASKTQNGLTRICLALGVTVIKAIGPGDLTKRGMVGGQPAFTPELPSARDPWKMRAWFDMCTAERHQLPEYVPDVVAGASGPVQLTDWKVRAIKLVAGKMPDFKAQHPRNFDEIAADFEKWKPKPDVPLPLPPTPETADTVSTQ